MTEQVKTYLIIGGVALVAYLVYKRATTGVKAAPVVASTTGTGNSVPAATGGGSGGEAGFWQNLGSIGKGLNSAVSSVESAYNSANNLLGLGSTDTGTGNNGTAG